MMVILLTNNELSPAEYTDLHGASVRIASHITDGSEIEKEVMDSMGGEIYETEWEQFEREVVNPLKQQIIEKDEQISDMGEQIANYASENALLKQKLSELQSK